MGKIIIEKFKTYHKKYKKKVKVLIYITVIVINQAHYKGGGV